MAEKTVVNPQVTDAVNKIPEKPGGDAGDAKDFNDPTPAVPVGGNPG